MILQNDTITKGRDIMVLRKKANHHPLPLHLLEFSGQKYSNSSLEFFWCICLKGQINLYEATLCEKITLQSTLKLRDFHYIPGTGLGDSVCQNTIIDPSDSNI